MKRKAKQAFAEHLLNNMTCAESRLWSRLSRKQIGYSFQRQAIVHGFIADFWCPEAKLVIEVDGGVHQRREIQQRDAAKDEAYANAKIDCLRFTNGDIYYGLTAALIRIWSHCNTRAPHPPRSFAWANPSNRFEETSEIKALRAYQEANRVKTGARRFSRGYWKSTPYSVHNA